MKFLILKKIEKIVCIAIAFVGSNATFALELDSYVYDFPADKNYISKEIINNTDFTNVYSVAIRRIDKPANGEEKVLENPNGELIFSPLKLLIPSGSTDSFKFFYNGPADDVERYYRVDFTESPVNALNDSEKNNQKKLMFFPTVSLSTFLIVRPRKINFSYEVDERSGVIKNSGNTFFKVIIHQGCDGKDEDSTQFYMLPNEQYQNEKVKGENKKFIVMFGKYIPIGNSCFQMK